MQFYITRRLLWAILLKATITTIKEIIKKLLLPIKKAIEKEESTTCANYNLGVCYIKLKEYEILQFHISKGYKHAKRKQIFL